LSVNDIVSWWKLYIDSIENFLKEWQEEIAARFANKLWLPEELKADLVAREEQAKKKRMDDYVERLKSVDSGPATEMIEWWLLNKNSPEFKKEAWLTFMLEKYWVLCAKRGLYKHKWKFLWYQALGWKIWDPLYNKIKAESEADDHTFTEEQLVYILLIKQCQPGWYNWIKRRSRLHKEFKKLRATWKEEEFNTWKQDGWDISKCDDIVEFTLWELSWWTYPNAIWWLEVAVERWGSMETMNKIPFVMLFSWSAYSMEESSRDKLRKMPEKGMILPIISLIRYKSWIDLATNTILELSKRIEELEPSKYPWIWARAQNIFDNMQSTSVTEKQKIEECAKFYDDYSKILTQSLYWLNTWKNTEDPYISNMIFLEKDDFEKDWEKHKWNITFKKYYNQLQASSEMYHYKEDFMSDAHKWAWVSWFDAFQTMEFALKINSAWNFVNHKWWPALLDEMIDQINYLAKSDLDLWAKKKLILKNLRWIMGAINALSTEWFNKTPQIKVLLSRIWIDVKDIKNLEATEHEILHPHNWDKVDILLNAYLNNILNKSSSSDDVSDNTSDVVNSLLSPSR
jgi:hypothetical protein